MISTADILPNQTLFCYNLCTKIKLRDLKSCIFEFFSPYGRIVCVVASKYDPKSRGNAFVVFSDIVSATVALQALNGKEFLGRPIGINYSKTKSDKIAMLDGTFKIQRKKVKEQYPVNLLDNTGNVIQNYNKSSDGNTYTLFVENIPSVMNDSALTILFKQYPGFSEARIVAGRGVGFVEYQNELQAELAMQGLNGFYVTADHALKITMAKK